MLTVLESGGPFAFQIPSSSELTLLPQTILHSVCKIAQNDGFEIDPSEDFSTVNIFPHSLFSQIDFEIDGVNLSFKDNLYTYKAYLETLLTYGFDSKYSHLTTSHFSKDTADHFDDLGDGNNGYAMRKQDVTQGKLFDFCTPLHIDFAHTGRVIPPGVPMKIKLTRSKD